MIADRLSAITTSASELASQKARDLRSAGVKVFGLSAGEPDFPTPAHIVQAECEALIGGETRYTAIGGTLELREAIARKFLDENGLTYDPSQIIVSAGAKAVIANAFLASLNPGDEVVIPAPHWVSYVDMVKMAGGRPVIVQCREEQSFKLDPDMLAAAITPRTKWVVLNSPTNPTGVVYSQAELRAIGEVVLKYPGILVITDDIYEHIIFDGLKFSAFAQAVPEMLSRTLTVNGLSKAYSMTGWRVGFAGGPTELIAAMKKVQSQLSGSNCSVTQAAALAALRGPKEFIARRAAIFQARRDYCLGRIAEIEGLSCKPPQGTFYLFVSCKDLLSGRTPSGLQINSDLDFTNYLLEQEHIVTVPGRAYGTPGYFRISFATSDDVLAAGFERLAAAVKALSFS